jgi:ABC-type branched-subunit amino acid transport system substrate-binding protein
VKIALVAPFEGRYRDVGYEVIYAVRLAVREANAGGGVAGYSVELLALDDSGDPEMAVAQARKVAADPQVVGGIGHWLGEATAAAAPEYEREGIPLLATGYVAYLPASAFRLWFPESPCMRSSSSLCTDSLAQLRLMDAEGLLSDLPHEFWIYTPAPLPADSADPSFADRYRAISSGVEPSFNAVLAYDATRLLFDAIARDARMRANRQPTRAGVAVALTQTDYSGLSGHFSFDANHNWAEVQTWIYQWREGKIVKP